jgi:hypothetical protein
MNSVQLWQKLLEVLKKKFDMQSIQLEGEQIEHPGNVSEHNAH